MPGIPRVLLLVLPCIVMPVRAAGVPDTGQTRCYSDTAADPALPTALESIARDGGTHPRQDCRYGRDAATIAGAITKTGAGPVGFDFTKIANNGSTLPAGAALGTAPGDWACTRDNVTGLTWEVKSPSDLSLRYAGWQYRWKDGNGATNGGSAGGDNDLGCGAFLGGHCNTEAFVAAVNASQLCTYSDWRLPSQRELLALGNFDQSLSVFVVFNSVSTFLYSNTTAMHWSATTFAENATKAWGVWPNDGRSDFDAKASSSNAALLVRGGPF